MILSHLPFFHCVIVDRGLCPPRRLRADFDILRLGAALVVTGANENNLTAFSSFLKITDF